MSEVTRYFVHVMQNGADFTGQVVTASDYDALQQRLATMEALHNVNTGATCDWGECDAIARAIRKDEKYGWLPVCGKHSVEGERLAAVERERNDARAQKTVYHFEGLIDPRVDDLQRQLQARDMTIAELTRVDDSNSARLFGMSIAEVRNLKASIARMERALKFLDKAVEKFLLDTSIVPPWESAGTIWAMRIKELQMSWLDSREIKHALREGQKES